MAFDIGNGIRLTEFRQSDRDALVEHLSNKEVYKRTLRIPFPYTADDADNWLATVSEKADQPSRWAIRNQIDLLIGGVGFDDLILGQSHRAEIGYWLAQPYWGRGIMPAAVRAVCRHAFETLGLVKITGHVFSFNDASARVLEKCGFQLEGYLRKHFVKDGQFLDAKAYGLVR